MKPLSIKFAALFFLLLFFMGCTPSLHISNQDPANKLVQIIINGNMKATLEYGQSKSFSVSGGVCTIEAFPSAKTESTMIKDEKKWKIWIEKNAILTLLPPSGAL